MLSIDHPWLTFVVTTVFIGCRNLLIYCPLARWIFYPDGWLASWGVLVRLSFVRLYVLAMTDVIPSFYVTGFRWYVNLAYPAHTATS
jgi:hypothetical protein